METMGSRVVGLTQDLVRRSKLSGDDDGGQALIAERLSALGFVVENVPLKHCDNLLALRGDGLEYVAFSGHTDVVPAGDGWSVDPFLCEVVGDRLIGRGVADMKGAVAAWLIALEDFVTNTPQINFPIAVLIAGDEEVASQGTRAMLERLYSRNQKVLSCLVGEPSATKQVGDCIRVARRGSLSAKIRLVGTQGHVAYPHLARNPIHAACRMIQKLMDIDFDEGLPTGLVNEKDEGWPVSSLQCSGITAGVGGATNVIPGEAEFRFNIRFRPPLTRDALIERLTPVLTDSEIEVHIDWSGGSKPYDSQAGELREVVLKVLSDAGKSPKVSRDGGTSDGRFFAEYGTEVVEFGPCNETIHKVDECLELSELEQLSRFYYAILEELNRRWE